MRFFRKWIKTDVETKNGYINDMLSSYDDYITEVIDLIPLSDIIDSDDEDIRKMSKIYSDGLSLMNKAFNVMIDQDNRLRKIDEKQEKILKRLDEISRQQNK